MSVPHSTPEAPDSNSVSTQQSGLSDKIGRALLERPALFATVVVLAIALLPVAVWLDLRNLSQESLARQATDLNSMISEIRGYYARNVVGRIQNNNGNSTPAHNYEEIPGGIPIPATLSIELGSIIGKRGSNIQYRFVSDEVFSGRSPHQLDAFETSALDQLRRAGQPNNSVTQISSSLLHGEIQMAVPVIMGQACVSCHNSHLQSPKKDWKVGDVRGIQSITIGQPIAANIWSFKFLLSYLLCAGAFGIAFAALQWRQATRFQSMNLELEEANSFLAAVSIKISKYLSPQVYKTIFSGERDVVISTERKKLTIFFSDIKDFTTTTERLQPEELTALLNEYFTEMTLIAEEYGATIDKFIGDAILAFFGDPETKGTVQDARACMEMAMAMQRRLAVLNQEWRRRGVEEPFQVRMGINTGYCNVGNFGSTDRMDYTIIGAEANLAARLQDIAPPGGIVMSYETYALIEDQIGAVPLSPITLKGISREIIPYSVEDISDVRHASAEVLDHKSDRFNLHVDLANLRSQDVLEIEKTLQSALSKVRNHQANTA